MGYVFDAAYHKLAHGNREISSNIVWEPFTKPYRIRLKPKVKLAFTAKYYIQDKSLAREKLVNFTKSPNFIHQTFCNSTTIISIAKLYFSQIDIFIFSPQTFLSYTVCRMITAYPS